MFSVIAFFVTTGLVLCCEVYGAIHNRADVERMRVAATAPDLLMAKFNWTRYLSEDSLKLANAARLYHGTPLSSKLAAHSFSWKNCGSSSDLLVINSLSLTPDPLRAPGTFSLTFDVTIQANFDAPLKLSLELKKYEVFFWLTIPCIDDMGSCTYGNICQQLAGLTCPKPFDDNKIPCKCPFPKGRYTLPTSTFDLQKSVPSGDYFVQAQLSSGSQAVNCIAMYFSIA
jgi:ganglioside GM2 activator